jgi:hypothetical protein
MSADKYTIVNMNTQNIKIGNKLLKVGDSFSDASDIKWTANPQWLTVKSQSTGRITKFSRKQFESKDRVTTIKEFFLRSEKASTRAANKGVLNFIQSAYSFPERRLALVIGNSEYTTLNKLKNPTNDASDITDKLLDLGFDVMVLYNGSYREMRNALIEFSDKGSKYDVAMFYYSGHGIQEENQCYLIPIEAEMEFRSELNDKCIKCRDVLDKLDESKCATRIALFDACRTQTTWNRGNSNEPMTIEGSPGTSIIFSTRSERVAQDGDGHNSPFATALLKNIDKPISYPEFTQMLVKDTYSATGSQYPSAQGSLLTEFKFNPKASTANTNSANSNSGTVEELLQLQAKENAQKQQKQPQQSQPQKSSVPVTAPALQKESPSTTASSTTPTKTDNISVDGYKISAYVDNYRRSGNNVMIDLYLYNNTSDYLQLSVSQGVAYDSFGNNYSNSNIDFSASGSNTSLIQFAPGVKIKTCITIKNVSNAVKSFSLIDLKFLVSGNNSNEYPHLKIKNCGPGFVGYTSSKLLPTASTSSSENIGTAETDTYDIFAKLIGVRRSGNTAFVDLYITNKTPDDIQLSLSNSAAYDQNGNNYSFLGFHTYGNNSGVFTLAPNVRARCVVEIKNISNATTSFPLIKLVLCQYSLGKNLYPLIEIKNATIK